MKKYNFTETQDWHYYFLKIFENKKIDSIIEFGLGVGTPFLADNCSLLKSVELSLGDYNRGWYDKTSFEMRGRQNWISEYIEVPEEIKEANSRAQSLRFPLEETKYLKILEEIIDRSIDKKEYDIIFVDPGIHLRGDIVNLAFGKSDIIAAHDTSRDPIRVLKNIYGYNIVSVPNEYEEIHFEDTHMGTTFWIKKELSDLVQIMKDYKVLR